MRVEGSGFRVSCFVLRVPDFVSRVSGFGRDLRALMPLVECMHHLLLRILVAPHLSLGFMFYGSRFRVQLGFHIGEG
jgi:hypothetical protein